MTENVRAVPNPRTESNIPMGNKNFIFCGSFPLLLFLSRFLVACAAYDDSGVLGYIVDLAQ